MFNKFNFENDRIKIVGRAGTGKTTTLVNIYKRLREHGISTKNIGMTTFTRSAANTFRERIGEEQENARTMHSHCWKLIGGTKENEITVRDKITFMNDFCGYNYDEKEKQKNTVWDFYKNINENNDLYRNKLQKITSEKDITVTIETEQGQCDINATQQDCRNIADLWKEFLVEYDKFDFTRTLEEVYENKLITSYTHMFFDEFQDFTPLQHEIFKLWTEAADCCYIAGDDCQTINTFAGADASFFINNNFDTIILGKTYRHGAEIFNNAQKYIDNMNMYIPAKVQPSSIAGETLSTNQFAAYIPHKKTFLIANTKMWGEQMRDNFFAEHKILPIDIEKIHELVSVKNAYDSLVRLQQGKHIYAHEVKNILKLLPTKIAKSQQTISDGEKEKKVKFLRYKVASELKKDTLFVRQETTMNEFFEYFDSADIDIQSIVKNIKNINVFGVYDFPNAYIPYDVWYMTIHQSKGMEADTVFLGTAVNYFDYQAFYTNHDLEAFDRIMRMWYVGSSRAKFLHVDYHGGLKTQSGGEPKTIYEIIS